MRRSIVVVVLFAAFTLGAQPRLPEGDSDAWARVRQNVARLPSCINLGRWAWPQAPRRSFGRTWRRPHSTPQPRVSANGLQLSSR